MQTKTADVVVIGGGPGGSAAAQLLAAKGWKVLLLEKDEHPRFHIGESLLPLSMPILEELGVLEQVAAIGMEKYGAEFVDADYEHTSKLYFAKALDPTYPKAYQVKRAEFDKILFENAGNNGVEAHTGVKVMKIDFSNSSEPVVKASDQDGNKWRINTRFIIDASGRQTFMASQLDSIVKNRHHASAAVFSHFSNVERLPGEDAGHISVFWFEHGWFWLIPFNDGTTSVGCACWPYYLKTRKNSLDEFLWDTINLVPKLKQRLVNSKILTPAQATGNYSYYNTQITGKNWLAIGDACAFVDPVFSTGVHFALNSAKLAAGTVDNILQNPNKQRRYLKTYSKKIFAALNNFTWMIYRITQPTMRYLFMHPRNILRVEEGLMSLLAGDVFRDTKVKRRLFIFKIFYYVGYMFDWRNNHKQCKLRRQSED